MNKNKSVLLLGSYGQTNLGDDLLMWNYLTYLRECGFTHIFVNASNAQNIPKPIIQAFPELVVLLTYRTSPLDWVRVLRRVAYAVYGGGTVYKELYGTTGRGKYSVISRIMVFNMLARLCGVQVYHLHIGIGTLKTRLGRIITHWALRTSRLTVFRDAKSYTFARDQLGLAPHTLCQATDGLFLTDRWRKVWHKSSLRLPKGQYKRVVGLNVLSDIPDWIDRQAYITALRDFAQWLLTDQQTLLVLLPFQHDFNPNSDYVFMQREILPHVQHYRNVKLVDHVPIDQAVAYFKQFDVFVGMRFHSLLLSTVAGVPFAGIAYDTKCLRFMREAGYPYALPLENADFDALKKVYTEVLSNLPKIPATLQAITEREQQKGQKCLQKLPF